MIRCILTVIGLALLNACSTLKASEEPAVLASAEDVEAAKALVAQALGRASVDLGEPSPLDEPMFVVLPSPLNPLETRSTAMPMRYDIQIEDDACWLIDAEDGSAVELSGIECVRVAEPE